MHEDMHKRANVLFVDDEKRVLTSMRAMFRREYNVSLASSGLEALEVLGREDIDVIVSDQRMPGMTGVEVLKAFKDHAPNAMRILLTGYADQEAIAASINEGEVFRYLTKPCPQEVLKQTIALAVEAVKGPQVQAMKAATAGAVPIPDTPVARLIEPVAQPGEALPADDCVAPVASGPAPVVLEGKDVELLLLSNDPQLTTALDKALEQSHVLHAVEHIDQAVQALEKHAIGVLITDIAINADEVQALTSQLKAHVPELVTIVASDHSDAHRLIDLINGGQVFRFLLKPIKPKQTSIWIESAVGKHVELVRHPELLARHVVDGAQGSSLRKLGDQLVGIASRFMRFRDRAPQANQT
jgi:DNA-binding NtrC family response regulator